MSFLRYFIIILCCFYFESCTKVESKKEVHYFNLEDVLNEQKLVLPKLKPRIEKKFVYNYKKDTINLDALDWKNEFIFFNQFNLEKLKTKEAISEIRTNTILTYKFENKSNINSYIVELDSLDRVKQVDIKINSSNFFYTKKQNVKLTFGLYSETFPLLLNYELNSEKEILFLEPEIIQIFTKLNFD